jgi:hypothetical protein
MVDTVDVGYTACQPDEIESMFGEYELGDGIELSVFSADRQGSLKFEFVKAFGYACGPIREPLVIREEAWRSLVKHTREIDVWLLQCKHEVFELSDDTTLATCFTTSGDRYVRLRLSEKNGRAKTFELTHAAWTYLANEASQISCDADALRRY